MPNDRLTLDNVSILKAIIMKLVCIILVGLLCAISGCKSSAPNECNEKPKENCMCTRQYDPVCGCNNETYGNSCEAECNGIMKYTKGACGQ